MKRLRLLLLLLSPFLACTGLAALFGCLTPFTEAVLARRFGAEQWRVGSIRERGRMARDLETSGRLIGLTRPEVIELLGEPDRGSENEFEIGYAVDIGYRLASHPWLYGLTVQFDPKSGRVSQAFLGD